MFNLAEPAEIEYRHRKAEHVMEATYQSTGKVDVNGTAKPANVRRLCYSDPSRGRYVWHLEMDRRRSDSAQSA